MATRKKAQPEVQTEVTHEVPAVDTQVSQDQPQDHEVAPTSVVTAGVFRTASGAILIRN